MCGLTGFWTFEQGNPTELFSLGAAMGRTISYRGPDDEGQWADHTLGLVLAHRR